MARDSYPCRPDAIATGGEVDGCERGARLRIAARCLTTRRSMGTTAGFGGSAARVFRPSGRQGRSARPSPCYSGHGVEGAPEGLMAGREDATMKLAGDVCQFYENDRAADTPDRTHDHAPRGAASRIEIGGRHRCKSSVFVCGDLPVRTIGLCQESDALRGSPRRDRIAALDNSAISPCDVDPRRVQIVREEKRRVAGFAGGTGARAAASGESCYRDKTQESTHLPSSF